MVVLWWWRWWWMRTASRSGRRGRRVHEHAEKRVGQRDVASVTVPVLYHRVHRHDDAHHHLRWSVQGSKGAHVLGCTGARGQADLQQLDGRDEHREFLGEPLACRAGLRQAEVKVHDGVHRVVHRGELRASRSERQAEASAVDGRACWPRCQRAWSLGPRGVSQASAPRGRCLSDTSTSASSRGAPSRGGTSAGR